MALEALNLPALPDGWLYETSPGSTEIVCMLCGLIMVPCRSICIIDMASGWCTPHRVNSGNELPQGRN